MCYRQRKTLLLSSPMQPTTLWPKAPDFANIFFYGKLFATIILSWNLLKCIFWYLLKLSDPFIKNENSVLAILIEKNFEQKTYFCLLRMRSTFFKEKSNFFNYPWIKITEIIFSTSCRKFKFFPFIIFEKKRLAQGIRRPKAADSPLYPSHTWIPLSQFPKLYYTSHYIFQIWIQFSSWFISMHFSIVFHLFHHPTMRENHRDSRSGLTRRVLYFFGQKNFDVFFNVYRR